MFGRESVRRHQRRRRSRPGKPSRPGVAAVGSGTSTKRTSSSPAPFVAGVKATSVAVNWVGVPVVRGDPFTGAQPDEVEHDLLDASTEEIGDDRLAGGDLDRVVAIGDAGDAGFSRRPAVALRARADRLVRGVRWGMRAGCPRHGYSLGAGAGCARFRRFGK